MSGSSRPLKVFLCHASADKPAVRALHLRLAGDGAEPWLDAENLLPGQNWQTEIPNAVRASDVVLVCLSGSSINKEGYVQKEIRFALDKAAEMPEGRIFLIPARLEDCRVPERLSPYQWVDLFSEDGYERLIKALRIRAEQIGAEPPGRKGWLSRAIPKPGAMKSRQDVPVSLDHEKPKEEITEAREARRRPFKLTSVIIAAALFFVLAISIAALADYIYGLGMFFPYPPDPTASATRQPVVLPTYTPDAHATPAHPIAIVDAKGIEMLLVSEGKFEMGSETGAPDAHPVHQIYLDSYYIDKYEVTNALYKACVDAGVCEKPNSVAYEDPKFVEDPVTHVDWNMAKVYCLWREARLPTEAEWEKAARGTDGRTYPWGEGIDDTLANYGSNVFNTSKVGSYSTGISPYGLFDMAGNVREWVADWYDETYYSRSPGANPTGPEGGDTRVQRGGSWGEDAVDATSFLRNRDRPDTADDYAGFRCVRTAVADAQSMPGTAPGSEATSLEITDTMNVQMVLVPEGGFTMGSDDGSDDEQPAHRVYLSTYYIDKYEVTNEAYKACVFANICDRPYSVLKYNNPYLAQHPVVYVGWNMARTYCEWRGARLPTEAEWEKAARGTDTRIFPWGNEFNAGLLNFCDKNCSYGWADEDSDDGYPETSPIGNYPDGVSPYGAYDMAGNVWEWVADWYSGTFYTNYPLDKWPSDPIGPASGVMRVLKGGSWNSKGDSVHSAIRNRIFPTFNGNDYGFRCAKSVP